MKRVHPAETGAFPSMLDRPEADAHVRDFFGPKLDALKDLVDYGTHLVPRCLASSKGAQADIVLLPVLGKQIIGLLDAGHVLLAAGCVTQTLLPLRAAFEASIYAGWIMRRDCERRARAYYVANLRRRLHWAKRGVRGTEEHRFLEKDFRALPTPEVFDSHKAEIASEVEAVSEWLKRPKWRQMNAAFDRRRGTRPYDPDWYTVVLPRKGRKATLYTLAKQVGRRAEYRLIYEQGSEMMHSSRMTPHVVFGAQTVHLRPLRELTDFSYICGLVMGVALSAYMMMIDHYRPAERENFARAYAARWREAYLADVRVNYEWV